MTDVPELPEHDAVYLRGGLLDSTAYKLHRLPVVGHDDRDLAELVVDPNTGELVRANDATWCDSACLYLGLYNRGRQPSWGALEGAKAIMTDRGVR
jgi:hypothetical protein